MLTYLPSPDSGVWHLGPLPLRAYAFGIIIGALLSIWIAERRLQARGGRPGVVGDIAMWAIPAGIVGARIYHVVTDYELYFGGGQDWTDVFRIWEGGLGIWGAISGGALGAWYGCHRYGVRMRAFADALAPGLLVAQAVGRIGNWFNQELFGKPTTVPWALEIDPDNRPSGYEQFETFHPTFLYEAVWNLLGAALIVWLGHRFRLHGGRVFALYVMVYTAGRFWIEQLRIDPANEIGPFRLNVWTSVVVFLLGLAYFVWATLKHVDEPGAMMPGHEVDGPDSADDADDDAVAADADDATDPEVASAAEVPEDSEPGAPRA
ncbi:prolipoprotein diacylglyceryl transferase [Aeromicrobium sp. IC_218]|uniref:prolipoprotein diacylglyceryl transferase n=1 Tax=Aeromicrobium sp. IC_218 TaxID=2545468 RepID=UPI00103AD70C|nr:prolipoprotein diacylglyceryl transferase [Aeromicrobium sp. IC_218]TCI99798.1 prolipoprotein diacylglyceryl transferase [Aeromicrobium sp. IC_218]